MTIAMYVFLKNFALLILILNIYFRFVYIFVIILASKVDNRQKY